MRDNFTQWEKHIMSYFKSSEVVLALAMLSACATLPTAAPKSEPMGARDLDCEKYFEQANL
jgi:hypothetical protein